MLSFDSACHLFKPSLLFLVFYRLSILDETRVVHFEFNCKLCVLLIIDFGKIFPLLHYCHQIVSTSL